MACSSSIYGVLFAAWGAAWALEERSELFAVRLTPTPSQVVYRSESRRTLVVSGSSICANPRLFIDGMDENEFAVVSSTSTYVALRLEESSWPAEQVVVTGLACKTSQEQDRWALAPWVGSTIVATTLDDPTVTESTQAVESPLEVRGSGFRDGTYLELSSPSADRYRVDVLNESAALVFFGSAPDSGPLRVTRIDTDFGSVVVDVQVATQRGDQNSSGPALADRLLWNLVVLLVLLCLLVVRLAVRWTRRRRRSTPAQARIATPQLVLQDQEPQQQPPLPSDDDLDLLDGVLLADLKKPAPSADEAAPDTDTLARPLLV